MDQVATWEEVEDGEMSQMKPYDRGYRDGVRSAVTFLHNESDGMNDPQAKLILNNAAFHLGQARARSEMPKKRAPECLAVGCTRRTNAPTGYCFQHTDMAPHGAKRERNQP